MPEPARRLIELDGRAIETYASVAEGGRIPAVISMGNWEPAFRAFGLMLAIRGRSAYALSYRGRGGSPAPDRGFDWADHAADLKALVDHYRIERAAFIAFSKGVSYTLGYLEANASRAAGLVLIDYPAIHCESASGYAEQWHSRVYRGYRLSDHVDKRALEGIERESTFKDFLPLISRLDCPILVCRGTDGQNPIASNLGDEDIANYRRASARVETIEFGKSGHMIFDDEPERLYAEISRFLSRIDG